MIEKYNSFIPAGQNQKGPEYKEGNIANKLVWKPQWPKKLANTDRQTQVEVQTKRSHCPDQKKPDQTVPDKSDL